jgi:hypothetical protein
MAFLHASRSRSSLQPLIPCRETLRSPALRVSLSIGLMSWVGQWRDPREQRKGGWKGIYSPSSFPVWWQWAGYDLWQKVQLLSSDLLHQALPLSTVLIGNHIFPCPCTFSCDSLSFVHTLENSTLIKLLSDPSVVAMPLIPALGRKRGIPRATQ